MVCIDLANGINQLTMQCDSEPLASEASRQRLPF